jgi:hypothetical protein
MKKLFIDRWINHLKKEKEKEKITDDEFEGVNRGRKRN